MGQLVALGQAVLEILEGMFVGQVAEQEHESGLFVAEVALAVVDNIVDAVSSVKQLAFGGSDISVLVLGIADNVGDFGQTDPDAGAVLVAEAFLDIVFFEERIGNIRKNRGFAVKSGKDAVVVKSAVIIVHSRVPFQNRIFVYNLSGIIS